MSAVFSPQERATAILSLGILASVAVCALVSLGGVLVLIGRAAF